MSQQPGYRARHEHRRDLALADPLGREAEDRAWPLDRGRDTARAPRRRACQGVDGAAAGAWINRADTQPAPGRRHGSSDRAGLAGPHHPREAPEGVRRAPAWAPLPYRRARRSGGVSEPAAPRARVRSRRARPPRRWPRPSVARIIARLPSAGRGGRARLAQGSPAPDCPPFALYPPQWQHQRAGRTGTPERSRRSITNSARHRELRRRRWREVSGLVALRPFPPKGTEHTNENGMQDLHRRRRDVDFPIMPISHRATIL